MVGLGFLGMWCGGFEVWMAWLPKLGIARSWVGGVRRREMVWRLSAIRCWTWMWLLVLDGEVAGTAPKKRRYGLMEVPRREMVGFFGYAMLEYRCGYSDGGVPETATIWRRFRMAIQADTEIWE